MSRIERILSAIAGDSVEVPKPESRIEKLLTRIYEQGGTGGGGGGASDYSQIGNKPSINGRTLNGDMSLEDIGIGTMGESEIDEIFGKD